jgi:hypothetical protein
MTAPSQAEWLKWAVCPIRYEDLRCPRYFGTRDAAIDSFKVGAAMIDWRTPLPVISILDYSRGGSPRFHLNASTFPIDVTAPPSLTLVENPPEWTDSKFQSRGLLHSVADDEITVPLPDELDPGEAIEYGKDLEAEIDLAIALPDCCLSVDSLADEVEKLALQFPGNDLTRKRASVREYLVTALWAYDDALVQIWPTLSPGGFAKWICSYQFQQYLHRSCGRLTRAPSIRQLLHTSAAIRSEVERVRNSLQIEIARYALESSRPIGAGKKIAVIVEDDPGTQNENLTTPRGAQEQSAHLPESRQLESGPRVIVPPAPEDPSGIIKGWKPTILENANHAAAPGPAAGPDVLIAAGERPVETPSARRDTQPTATPPAIASPARKSGRKPSDQVDGEKLKKYRYKAGLSQEKLAEISDVGVWVIQRGEASGRLSPPMLMKVAHALSQKTGNNSITAEHLKKQQK